MKVRQSIKQIVLPVIAASWLSHSAAIMAEAVDDPLLAKVMLDQLELDAKEGKAASWSAQAWLGYDLNKFWIKTEGEAVDSEIEGAELQALYSRAIAPFWDIQLGLKHDFKPQPGQTWAVIALQGLAPYYFELDSSLFFTKQGDVALRLEAEYELLLTQQWILSPELELNFYGQNDENRGTGSGLSDMAFGLRLRYEVYREFAPYIGLNWSKLYGNSAVYAAAIDAQTSETQLVIGLKAWF